MRRLSRISSWVAVISLLCCAGAWSYLIKRAQWNSENLFRQALRLPVGRTGVAQVLDFARTAPGKKSGFEPCIAGLSGCTGTISISNTFLSRFHLAPKISFGVRFGISNYVLTSREFGMSRDGMYGKDSYGVASVNERTPAKNAAAFNVSGWSSGILVNMTTDAPEILKALAYDFNFRCFTPFGGCKSYEDMLPILKRKDITGPDPWSTSDKH
jgi:hypothetical protein